MHHWSIPVLAQVPETIKAAEAARSWAELTPLGWIQAVGAFLLLSLVPLMIWLLKQMSRAQGDQINLLERLFEQSKVQTQSLVDKMEDQISQTRDVHREDMRSLFEESDKNREMMEKVGERIAAEIKYMASQIHQLPKPKPPRNGNAD